MPPIVWTRSFFCSDWANCIGIGAGADCDGQVLVINDLLGIEAGFTPKFVRRYGELDSVIRESIQDFRSDVISSTFPSEEESFSIPDEEFDKLASLLEGRSVVAPEGKK